MGHEFIGIVEDIGSDVEGVRRGDLVVSPFLWQDNTCEFCREGLQSSCRHGGQYGHDLDGGQGEAVRVPQARACPWSSCRSQRTLRCCEALKILGRD